MAKCKKNTLCLRDKIKLIDAFENEKVSVKDLRERFNCGKSQVYDALKRKRELLEMWESGSGAASRKRRRTGNEDINKVIWEWFLDAKSRNVEINGPLIQAQAKYVAEELGINFKASNGWLESFRKRHNIISRRIGNDENGVEGYVGKAKRTLDTCNDRTPVFIRLKDFPEPTESTETKSKKSVVPAQELGLDIKCETSSVPISFENLPELKQKLSNQTDNASDSNSTSSLAESKHISDTRTEVPTLTELLESEKWIINQANSFDSARFTDLPSWKQKLEAITGDYKNEDIFNGSGTSLLYRAVPNRTSLPVKKETCDGGERAEERLTVFLCCSMKGEKMKPLVVSKFEKPNCFGNLSSLKLPVTWVPNPDSWLTAEIMEDWLKFFNGIMKMQKRKVLLILRSESCYRKMHLTNVQLAFLPASESNRVQPLDHDIIRHFKAHYRKHCLQSIISTMTSNENVNAFRETATFLDAAVWISSSWYSVSQMAIENGFKRAEIPVAVDAGNDEDEEFFVLESMICKYLVHIPDACEADEYIDLDENIVTSGPVIDSFNQRQSSNSDNDDSRLQNYEEVLKALKRIRDFSLLMNDDQLFDTIIDAKNYVEQRISADVVLQEGK